MYEFIVINKTAQMKNTISINSEKISQAFHDHVQQFIDDNLDCVVSAQHYEIGDNLKL